MKSWKSNCQWLGVLAGTALVSTLNLMSAFGAPARDHRQAAVPQRDAAAAEHAGDEPRSPPVLRGLQRRLGPRWRRRPRHAVQDRPTFVYYGYFESYPLLRLLRRHVRARRRDGQQDVRRRAVERRLAELRHHEPHRCAAQGALRRPAVHRYGHARRCCSAPSFRRTRTPGARNTQRRARTATTSATTRRCALPSGSARHLFANTTPLASAVTIGQRQRRHQRRRPAAVPRAGEPRQPHLGLAQHGTPGREQRDSPGCLAGSASRRPTTSSACRSAPGQLRSSDPRNNCQAYSTRQCQAHRPAAGLWRERLDDVRSAVAARMAGPHDGGVLRKGVASLQDEVDLANGRVRLQPEPQPGIISTIDRLRVTAFNGWRTHTTAAGSPTARTRPAPARCGAIRPPR